MATLAALLDSVVDRIERAHVLDGLADKLVSTGAKAVPTGPVKDAASGTWLGHPLHPLLVAIPIGSWSAASILDARGQDDGAKALVGIGLLAAAPTAFSGYSDWLDTQGAEQRVGLAHALTNYLTIGLYGASYVARRRGSTGAGKLLALAGAASMSLAGWLGGHLAYAQGVGVDTTAFEAFPTEWTTVADSDTVTEQPSSAEVDGIPFLLVRQGDTITAIADRCTHRGAPLHEGTVADGCVTCPWHGSVFSLSDGAVVRGPATRPQPAFEVRETGKNVQVRRSSEQRTLRLNPVGS